MINQKNSIPCPVCKSLITFDIRSLLEGIQFTCPNCNASIGISAESMGIVKETMEQFDKLNNTSNKHD